VGTLERRWMPALSTLGSETRLVLLEHLPLAICIAAYLVFGYVVEWQSGVKGMMQVTLYSNTMGLMGLCFHVSFLLGYKIWWLAHTDRARPLSQQFRFAELIPYLRPRRLLGTLLILGLLPPCMSAFSSFKQAIVKIAPFKWDQTFMRWDYWLHGGHHPWRLLHSLIGWPLVTSVMSFLYATGWMFIMFGILFWQAWSNQCFLRMRFFLSFVLMWALLGSVLAILMSSAGPCYYNRITSTEDPYKPLMNYLYEADKSRSIVTLEVQEILWNCYESGRAEPFAGISAMPSMHVAMAVLFALVGWQANRWLGVGLTFFAVMIQIGSVLLGWHYALDGYVGALLAVLIWHLVGWGLRRSRWIAEEESTAAETSTCLVASLTSFSRERPEPVAAGARCGVAFDLGTPVGADSYVGDRVDGL
jgi:membrane-associated phospholipid phosphatase